MQYAELEFLEMLVLHLRYDAGPIINKALDS